MRTATDLVRAYPKTFAGRSIWADRVFLRDGKSATALPLSSIWINGGPQPLKHVIGALRLLGRVDALLFSRLHERRYVEYARSRWPKD
jgi:hypothetical protein